MFINIQNQIDFLGTKNIYHIIDNCIVKKSDSIVNPFSDSTQNLLLKYKNIMKLDSSYLLSTNFGLMVFKDNKWKDCSISNSIDNYVNNIFIDNKKNIWAFTGNPSEQTLTKISSPTWEKFSSKNLPIIFSGQKIIQDNNENIWIADDNIFDYTKNLLKIYFLLDKNGHFILGKK